MLTVVSYDIADDRRRNRLSQALKDFGERVQYSVFECHLTLAEVEQLRARVVREIDAGEDRVRIYRFCEDCGAKGEALGQGRMTEDPEVYVL